MAAPDVIHVVMKILMESGLVPLVSHPVVRGGNPVTEVSIYGEKLPARPLMDATIVNVPATAFVVKTYPGRREESGGLRMPRVLLRAYAGSLSDVRELSDLADELLHDQTFDVVQGADTFRIYLEMGAGPNSDLEDGTQFPFCDRIYSTAVI
jgi:hypothetical protein